MTNRLYDVSKHHVQLKKPFPSLPYDLAIHCGNILTANPYPFPDYLHDFHQQLSEYAAQTEEVKPKRFPKGHRIYVIDQRLHIPLILHDTTGEAYDLCYSLAKSRPMSEYVFGNGMELEQSLRYGFGTEPDRDAVEQFVGAYGFLPFDEFAMPTLLMLQNDEFKALTTCSWHVILLLEKYRQENLVDLSASAQPLSFLFS